MITLLRAWFTRNICDKVPPEMEYCEFTCRRISCQGCADLITLKAAGLGVGEYAEPIGRRRSNCWHYADLVSTLALIAFTILLLVQVWLGVHTEEFRAVTQPLGGR